MRTTGPERQHSDILLGKLLICISKFWVFYVTPDPRNHFFIGVTTPNQTLNKMLSHLSITHFVKHSLGFHLANLRLEVHMVHYVCAIQ